MSDFASGFPPLYARWMQSFFSAPLPPERKATCGDCPMIKEEGAGLASTVRFGTGTKCCTFFPEIPSYFVGGVLADEDPGAAEGRRRLAARVEDGQQVTPLGIGRPAVYYKVYGNAETFGVAHALKCPYYIAEEGGLCGVWKHREATCATWFCKHERGQFGYVYWRGVRRLLKGVEQRLTREVAIELGIDVDALNALASNVHTLSKELEPDYYAAIWGKWHGREVEYFKTCAERVAPMGWDEVRARCGQVLDELVEEARDGKEALDEPRPLPDLVRIRPLHHVRSETTHTVLQAYSSFDALRVPHTTALALLKIDGRKSTEVVLKELAGEGIDRPLLEHLIDVALLEDAKLL